MFRTPTSTKVNPNWMDAVDVDNDKVIGVTLLRSQAAITTVMP
jgi:hypothetical protein